ncbi:MAG: 4-hydroxy-tetrahydrodipicolinate reductase [Flavipsychrobacter sp.]
MNIALIGYGKMGQTIERIATERGHNIVLRISTANKHEMNGDNLKQADVAIEFTKPEAAEENVMKCLQAGVSVVCGTTGWNHGLSQAKYKAIENKLAFLHASNFSIGVNIFFEINKLLATLMDEQPSYEVSIEETHHTQKKDAPSGTAITLAEQILMNIQRKRHWTKDATDNPEAFPIIAHRVEGVPGTHNVKYTSAIDDIEIIHTAHNRDGFALGAVLAAEFIQGKEGIFEMKDVLGIGNRL